MPYHAIFEKKSRIVYGVIFAVLNTSAYNRNLSAFLEESTKQRIAVRIDRNLPGKITERIAGQTQLRKYYQFGLLTESPVDEVEVMIHIFPKTTKGTIDLCHCSADVHRLQEMSIMRISLIY